MLFAAGGEIADKVSKFSSMRSSFPPVVMATPCDKLPAPWTGSSSPSHPVLLRLQLLARESLSLLEDKLSGSSCFDSSLDIEVRIRSTL